MKKEFDVVGYEIEVYPAWKAIVRRFSELLLMDMFLSAILTVVCSGMLFEVNQRKCFVWSSIAVLIYFIVNVIMLNGSCRKIRDTKKYFVCSYAAYALFAVLTFILFGFANKEFYTWFFSITKFAQFSEVVRSTHTSIILFHLIMCVAVLVAPINVTYVWNSDKYNSADYAYDPENDYIEQIDTTESEIEEIFESITNASQQDFYDEDIEN